MKNNNYKVFALTLALSLCIMYAVMFMNVDSYDHIYLSLTRLYMSLLMVCPMALLMLLFMSKMYTNKKRNTAIVVSAIVIFVTAFTCLRNQTFISDKEYMQAMIPHHSSAIMTSKHAAIKDPELKKLSDSIIASQQREIEQMKGILKRLDK